MYLIDRGRGRGRGNGCKVLGERHGTLIIKGRSRQSLGIGQTLEWS